MIENVFEQIQADRIADKQSKLKAYFALLAKIDLESPSEKDRKTLATLMAALQKNAVDAKKDHATIQEMRRHAAHAATLNHAIAAQDKAHEAYMAGCAERQRIHAEINAKVTQLNGALTDANNALEAARRGVSELKRAETDAPELFAAIQ